MRSTSLERQRHEPDGAHFHIDPKAPLGTSARPLGDLRTLRRGRFLMGIRCVCGSTSLVFAGAIDGDAPVPCPKCGSDLR